MSQKILAAMSGGVDSSVTALLLKERGFECTGATMSLFRNKDIGLPEDMQFCQADDIRDAENVCKKLGIDHLVLNMQDEFRENVIERFVNSYENGATPNPCIYCNRSLKFGELLKQAIDLGFSQIATGHYARTEYDSNTGRYLLKKAKDPKKDQSYVLYGLTQEVLSRVCFPLGDLTKEEVRRIASENGFENAQKSESQDICFIKDMGYPDFIEHYTGKKYEHGDFLDLDGKVIGRHKGIIRYTVGQRKGLGIAAKEPLYVYDKDIENNTVILAGEKDLYSEKVTVRDYNLIMTDHLEGNLRITAKTRYNQEAQPAIISRTDDDMLELIFDEPQRAITKGQAAVIYYGDYVFGGGTIV